MTVWDLIGQLTKAQPGDRVAIPIEKAYPTVGGTPKVFVGGIKKGFDWDQGTVFLNVVDNQKLTVMSREEYLEHIRYKQMVSSLRGKEEISHLSDTFVKKSFVVGLLKEFTKPSQRVVSAFEIENIINSIQEEKL